MFYAYLYNNNKGYPQILYLYSVHRLLCNLKKYLRVHNIVFFYNIFIYIITLFLQCLRSVSKPEFCCRFYLLLYISSIGLHFSTISYTFYKLVKKESKKRNKRVQVLPASIDWLLYYYYYYAFHTLA